MQTEEIKIHNGEWLTDALKRQGYENIPSNVILDKTLTGLGATHTELHSNRNSIIIEPNVPVIIEKTKDNPDWLAVWEKCTPSKVEKYLQSTNKRKKLICTPESFSKIRKAANKLNLNIYTDYFCLMDECEKFIQDVDYRKRITQPIYEFFQFQQKALVSATPLEMRHKELVNQNFRILKIVPEYDYRKNLEVIVTNSYDKTVKSKLDDLQDSPCVCIFINSTNGINKIINTLKLTDYEALRDETNFLAAVSPNVSSSGQLIAGNNNYPASVNGVGTEYLEIRQLSVESGEMFTEADIQNAAKVCIIGKTISVEQLEEEGFKGVFVASGAGLPNFMNIPGENLVGVMSSNEYLTRVNLMDAANPDSDTPVLQGKKVAVIGGGNTAMDSVRTARRLGAERAMIVYRRSEEEMPARLEEVKHAKEEGVEFMTLHNPVEYLGDERGRVKQMRLQKMELGEPDASGRRRPVPVEGAIETIDVDEVIVSVGVSPNPLIPRAFQGLEVSKKGTIVVNEENMRSALPDVYAGGDIVRGGATVILAMGDGRKAAAAMDEALRG